MWIPEFCVVYNVLLISLLQHRVKVLIGITFLVENGREMLVNRDQVLDELLATCMFTASQHICCGMLQQRTLILSDLRLYLFSTKLFDVLKQHLSDGRLSVALCPCQARVLRAGASVEILVQESL